MQCEAGGAKLRTNYHSKGEEFVAHLPVVKKDAPLMKLSPETDAILGPIMAEDGENPPAQKESWFTRVKAFFW
jgi:hypothetical protein